MSGAGAGAGGSGADGGSSDGAGADADGQPVVQPPQAGTAADADSARPQGSDGGGDAAPVSWPVGLPPQSSYPISHKTPVDCDAAREHLREFMKKNNLRQKEVGEAIVSAIDEVAIPRPCCSIKSRAD